MYSVKPQSRYLMIPAAYLSKDLQAYCFVESHLWLIEIPVKFSADASRFRVKWSNMRAL
jgi:hypothetical protein